MSAMLLLNFCFIKESTWLIAIDAVVTGLHVYYDKYRQNNTGC